MVRSPGLFTVHEGCEYGERLMYKLRATYKSCLGRRPKAACKSPEFVHRCSSRSSTPAQSHQASSIGPDEPTSSTPDSSSCWHGHCLLRGPAGINDALLVLEMQSASVLIVHGPTVDVPHGTIIRQRHMRRWCASGLCRLLLLSADGLSALWLQGAGAKGVRKYRRSRSNIY